MSALRGEWPDVEIQEITAVDRPIIYGIIKPGPDTPGGVPYVRVMEMTSGTIDVASLKRCAPERATKFKRATLRPGDVLVSKDGTIGKVAIVPPELDGGNITQHVMRVSPGDRIESAFLAWAIRAPRSQQWLVDEKKGAALQGVNVGDFRRMPIPLPPLDQQKRIVAKIEALTAKSRRAKRALDAIPPLLERFRQSVLASAFRGDLTKDWRTKNPDVEPASELLKRIRVERRARWEAAELEKLKAKGKTPKDDGWKSKYVEPEPVDTEGLPELPEGWCWATLGTLAWDSSYGTSEKCDYDGLGLPVLRIPNIAAGRLDLSDLKRAIAPNAGERDKLVGANDMLVVRTNGSRDLIGRAAVVDEPVGRDLTFASYLIRLRLIGKELPAWVGRIWMSPQIRRWLEDEAASSAGQYNIGLSALAACLIPVPPAQEHAEALRVLDRLLSRIDSVRDAFTQLNGAAGRLDAAILAKAFRGELVEE